MRYKLVIFDFDGTLADSFPWFVEVFEQIARKFGFRSMPRSDLEALRGCGPEEILRQLAIPTWKMPFIASHMRSLMASQIERIPLFPGVGALLGRLAGQGTATALVSSNSRANVERVLGPENAPLIGFYECGVTLLGKHSKFRKVLARSGVARSEAICVGDELRDLRAARSAGIAFGAVSWGYGKVESMQAHAPAEVFEDLDDLARKVA